MQEVYVKMARKTNVKKHSRRTKWKKIRVKKHKRRLNNRISRRKRRVFTGLARQPYETGGQLDFTKGELDNVKLHFGDGYELEFDWDPDYEVSWHTHPGKRNPAFPSYQDIVSMRETNEREGIIFGRNIALSVAESKKFQNIPDHKIREVYKRIQKDLNRNASDKTLYKKYKPIFRKELGLSLRRHSPNKDIRLHTKWV